MDDARVGRLVELEVDADDEGEARAQVERMCEQLLANPLIESYEIELHGRDVMHRAARSPADRRRRLPRLERRPRRRSSRSSGSARTPCASGTPRPSFPRGTAAVVLPGGFSYGDYLRCGAIARFSPVMARRRPLRRARAASCSGSATASRSSPRRGLLPGALRPNESLSFVCRDVGLTVERDGQPVHRRAATPGSELTIPVKHGEGCWFADAGAARGARGGGQILLRYAPGENPNGAVGDVAGVCNESGNVFGLMPHPEHAVDPLLGSADGALILGSLVDAARLSTAALV